MGRKAGFADQTVYAAMASGIADGVMPGIRDISKASGVSIGSLYHRFGSYEGLLAETWAWSEGAYLQGVISHIHNTRGVRGGLRAALYMPRFARRESASAPVLVSGQRTVLRHAALAQGTRTRAADILGGADAALTGFAEGFGLRRDEVELALIEYPRTVVAVQLGADGLDGSADALVRAAFWATISVQQQQRAKAA
ncbi:TetR/AcrR family transcriptional regulator [Aquicoccus sp.]|uniref:TetR/AcrR family transcriptional regulator n=1 Tax=Aquicoccus sp. TaxID=2055851 RepID=UPI0035630E1C